VIRFDICLIGIQERREKMGQRAGLRTTTTDLGLGHTQLDFINQRLPE